MSESLIFHCSQPVIDADGIMVTNKKGKVIKHNPTHTLVFEKLDDNSLIMGWAQAHKKDSYSKKAGRKIATDRVELLKNRLLKFPTRTVFILDTVTEQHLPKHVMNSSFDYYLNRAVKSILDIDSIEFINIYFRSVSQDEPVCSIKIDIDAIKESIAISEKVRLANIKANAETKNDVIFATFKQENGNILSHIQDRKDFYENGINHISDAYLNIIKNIVIDGKPEWEVILDFRNKGFSYDPNLELELI